MKFTQDQTDIILAHIESVGTDCNWFDTVDPMQLSYQLVGDYSLAQELVYDSYTALADHMDFDYPEWPKLTQEDEAYFFDLFIQKRIEAGYVVPFYFFYSLKNGAMGHILSYLKANPAQVPSFIEYIEEDASIFLESVCYAEGLVDFLKPHLTDEYLAEVFEDFEEDEDAFIPAWFTEAFNARN